MVAHFHIKKAALALLTATLAACAGKSGLLAGEARDGPAVTGIGGVFFKSDDPAQTRAWYARHLGIAPEGQGKSFPWREHDDPQVEGFTVWSIFPRASSYFGPSSQPFMINYRVRDLDGLLVKLKAAGIEQAGEVLDDPAGRFAWVVDGDGNRVELWEPR